MSKKQGKPSRYVRLDQLTTKEGFLRICRLDQRTSIKLDINMEFLEAAENEGFIKSIGNAPGTIKEKDGKSKEVIAPYYSPFQIYIVACLARNKVVDGKLQSDEDLDYQNDHNMRLLCWGWGALKMNISLRENNRKYHPEIPDIYAHCDDFHKLLTFLHTFEAIEHDFRDRQKMRMFNDTPSISYDFTSIKGKGSKVLDPFELSVDKLRALRRQVGQLAMQIDPLELWYPYISRHPRLKKDLLKGDAQLAQELYIIQDLIVEVLEILNGTKEPDLLTEIYQNRPLPMLLEKSEYASGTDLKAMQGAIRNFREWGKSELNIDYLPDGLLSKLDDFEKRLEAFEKKYGDKSYVSGLPRPVEYEEKLGIKDLDPETSKFVEQILKQEDAQDHYRDQEEMEELVASAISCRLDSLRRELWSIFNEVSEPLQKQINEAWNKVHNFGNFFWVNRDEKFRMSPREEQLKIYRDEEQKLRDEAQSLGMKRDELNEEIVDLRLIYCHKCRQRPVQIHKESGDQVYYDTFLCQVCKQKVDELSLSKLGEWTCYNCGSLLHKFNYENELVDRLINRVKFRLILEYGRLELTAWCSKCGKENLRPIDWGWAW